MCVLLVLLSESSVVYLYENRIRTLFQVSVIADVLGSLRCRLGVRVSYVGSVLSLSEGRIKLSHMFPTLVA